MSGKDLLDVIANFRTGFMSHGLEPPEVILLRNPDDGYNLLSAIEQKKLVIEPGKLGKPIEHPDGSIWMEVKVLGLKIRWPARKLAKHDGTYVWM